MWKILHNPGTDGTGVLLRVARRHRVANTERAAAMYRSALSAWVGADVGFGPRVETEAALARVGG